MRIVSQAWNNLLESGQMEVYQSIKTEELNRIKQELRAGRPPDPNNPIEVYLWTIDSM
jgi:hypothetical protein